MLTKRVAAIVTAYTGYTLGNFGDAKKYMQELMKKDPTVSQFDEDSMRRASKPDFINIVVDDDNGLTQREAAIITAFTGFCLGDFGEAHKYMEEAMGFPIWTHELANPQAWEEIREKVRPDFIALSDSVQ